MTLADQLIEEIARGKKKLQSLERQLAEYQKHCHHEYQETLTHRVCLKCKRSESLHY